MIRTPIGTALAKTARLVAVEGPISTHAVADKLGIKRKTAAMRMLRLTRMGLVEVDQPGMPWYPGTYRIVPGAAWSDGSSLARIVETIRATPMTAQSISRATGINLPAVHYGIRRASSGGLIEPAGFEAKQRLTSGNTPILWRAIPRPRREGA